MQADSPSPPASPAGGRSRLADRSCQEPLLPSGDPSRGCDKDEAASHGERETRTALMILTHQQQAQPPKGEKSHQERFSRRRSSDSSVAAAAVLLHRMQRRSPRCFPVTSASSAWAVRLDSRRHDKRERKRERAKAIIAPFALRCLPKEQMVLCYVVTSVKESLLLTHANVLGFPLSTRALPPCLRRSSTTACE